MISRTALVVFVGLAGGVTAQVVAEKRDLAVQAPPSGAIAGRVLGPDGEPAKGVHIYVRGRGGQQGSQTDEQGRFRIAGLVPGGYRLEALPLTWTHPSKSPQFPADGSRLTRLAPASYPDVIEVQAGNETGDISVRMARTPVVRVSGRVTGVPPGGNISLTVNTRHGGFSDLAKADGTFEFWNLDPGEYVIRAWEGTGRVDMAPDGSGPRNSALMNITVADANVENIELRIQPPSDISGQVGYETGVVATGGPERRLRISALDGNGGGAPILDADGHFSLNALLPGRYRVMCDCGSPTYVKSMWLGSTQIDGDILDLNDGPHRATLRVLLSTRFGVVSGTVQGDFVSIASLKVALVLVKTGTYRPPRFGGIDASGRYSFDAVVPGEYKLAVVEESDMLLQGAEGLDSYRPVVETVNVVAGESSIHNPGILQRR